MEPKSRDCFYPEGHITDIFQRTFHVPLAIIPQQILPPLWAKGLNWLIIKPWRFTVALCLSDAMAVALGIIAAFNLRSLFSNFNHSFDIFDINISYLFFSIITFSTMFYLNGGYGKINVKRPEDELRDIVLSNLYTALLVTTTIFTFNKQNLTSCFIIIMTFVLNTGLVVICRLGFRVLTMKLWLYGLARENVIIIGNSIKDIDWVLDHLNIQRHLGFNILGYMAQHPLEFAKRDLKYLGSFEVLPSIKEHVRVDKVFFAMQCDKDRHKDLINRLAKCARLKIPALIISQIFNNFHFDLALDGYTGVFEVNHHYPGYSSLIYQTAKRAIDIGLGLIMLLASLPIWLFAIISIKRFDGGPIFFRHRLVGKNGKLIDIYKFRTMVVNAREILNKDQILFNKFKENYKLADDPRLTPIGKFLRKTSLDELPQLINIFKGEMTLVGPRPVRVEELERFGEFKHERIKVRPGLTGFWQVSGRCSTSYEERILMDKFYMNKCSIWLDLIIILKTPLRIIKCDGAV